MGLVSWQRPDAAFAGNNRTARACPAPPGLSRCSTEELKCVHVDVKDLRKDHLVFTRFFLS